MPGPASETARTYEARLADGRWLQVNERRTRDGGFVSVGTDITALKEHEGQLIKSERLLVATVTQLRQSRRSLEAQADELAELADRYQEQKAEVVAKLAVDCVVVNEVAEVVEDTRRPAVEHMRRVAGNQRGAGIAELSRGCADERSRLRGHVRPPVGRDQHGALGCRDRLLQPARDALAEVGERHAWSVHRCGELARMVSASDDYE